MRQALGVRGAFRSALLSARHTDSLTSLITHSNVICDISSESDLNIEGRLLFGTIPYPATHPRLAKSKFSVKSNASITQFGESSRIGPGSVVHIEGDLLIGRSFIHSHARLICEDEITIGDGCAIAWGVEILDTDRHQLVIEGKKQPITDPIEIKDNVWIGHDVSIKKGVTVGSGAVIASDSVVTHDVSPNTLVGGIPAKSIRENIDWIS